MSYFVAELSRTILVHEVPIESALLQERDIYLVYTATRACARVAESTSSSTAMCEIIGVNTVPSVKPAPRKHFMRKTPATKFRDVIRHK
jgi:hypothetical protein